MKYSSKCDQTLWTLCDNSVWSKLIGLHMSRFEDFHTAGKDSRAGQSVSDRRPSGQLINGCFSRGWSIGLFRMCNFSYLAVIGGKSNQGKANNLARALRTHKIIFWTVQLILVKYVETENSFYAPINTKWPEFPFWLTCRGIESWIICFTIPKSYLSDNIEKRICVKWGRRHSSEYIKPSDLNPDYLLLLTFITWYWQKRK